MRTSAQSGIYDPGPEGEAHVEKLGTARSRLHRARFLQANITLVVKNTKYHYSIASSRRELHKALLCTALQYQLFSKTK